MANSSHTHTEPRPSKAAIAGHPIHPMLIPFPVTFIAMVPVADIIYLSGGGEFWSQAAYYLLWAGLVSGALAAVAGMIDFIGIKRARSLRQGWFHVLANVAVIGLVVVNIVIRAGDVETAIAPAGVILSVITAALLLISGWYGGELAYRHKIGVVGDRRAPRPERAEPERGRAPLVEGQVEPGTRRGPEAGERVEAPRTRLH